MESFLVLKIRSLILLITGSKDIGRYLLKYSWFLDLNSGIILAFLTLFGNLLSQLVILNRKDRTPRILELINLKKLLLTAIKSSNPLLLRLLLHLAFSR